MGTKINDKRNEPIEPDMVLLGLILVSFFPLKILPNSKPPMSENIQIKIINSIFSVKFSSEIPIKIIVENIVRYNKLNACINNFKKFVLKFFLVKILEIKP